MKKPAYKVVSAVLAAAALLAYHYARPAKDIHADAGKTAPYSSVYHGAVRPTPSEGKLYRCIRTVDGDTIIVRVEGRNVIVRLIGVDTPETVHPQKPVQFFGREASAFTRRMVGGKKVRLEFDQQRRDKYMRRLAYVYLEDGTFLNAEIIKQGYGYVYTRFPFRYMDEFRAYEREARKAGRGLWGGR